MRELQRTVLRDALILLTVDTRPGSDRHPRLSRLWRVPRTSTCQKITWNTKWKNNRNPDRRRRCAGFECSDSRCGENRQWRIRHARDRHRRWLRRVAGRNKDAAAIASEVRGLLPRGGTILGTRNRGRFVEHTATGVSSTSEAVYQEAVRNIEATRYQCARCSRW